MSGNFFGGTTSLGVDLFENLDTDNGDNEVYIIKDWKIVGREHHTGKEERQYKLDEMIKEIDKRQPIKLNQEDK